MAVPTRNRTPFPEANAVLEAFLTEVRSIMGDRIVGAYLSGSLAMGDFDQSSDLDLLVVTTEALPEEVVATLAAMHERFSNMDSKWGHELEVSYLPRSVVRRYDPSHEHALFPHIERGEHLKMDEHGRDWDLQRHIIRDWGTTVIGPDPRTLIDPVGPDAVREAVLAVFRRWWPREIEHPEERRARGYRSYLVLTGCRALYTLEHGTIATKPASARWAREVLGARWAALIDWAVEARREPGPPGLENMDEATAFMRYVLERALEYEAVDGTASEITRG